MSASDVSYEDQREFDGASRQSRTTCNWCHHPLDEEEVSDGQNVCQKCIEEARKEEMRLRCEEPAPSEEEIEAEETRLEQLYTQRTYRFE